MPFFRDLFTQIGELLAQQSTTKKLLAGLILLGALGFGGAQLLKYGRTVDYEVLYAGLDSETAKSITDSLKTTAPDMRVDLAQDDRGWTVRVPSSKALSLRLDLASTIQTGGGKVGWELFDKNSIGVTDFTQKINRQRATQGELERTIQSIDVVRMAKVKLAIPEDTLFVREEDQPKASVFVELYPKAVLSKSKVEAIQALVAGSTEGLARESVTVVDASGRLLSRAKGEEGQAADLDERATLVDQQEKQRKEYERGLEEKIQSALGNVYGANHVTAKVNVDFDFTVRETNELKYNPKNVPVAESISKNAYSKQNTGAQGLAGSPAHIPPEGASTATVTGAPSTPMGSEESITNYNVGKTETRTVFPPYQIRRITAAVLVDNTPIEEKDAAGKVIKKDAPTVDDQKQLEDIVKQIVNFSEERPGGLGDVVTVSKMAFRNPTDMTSEQTLDKMERNRLTVLGIKYGMIGLAALLFLLFIVRPLMHIIAPKPLTAAQLAAAGGLEPALLGPGMEHALLEAPDGSGEALAGPGQQGALLGGPTADEAADRQADIDAEILLLSKENPKKVSLVLRSWIDS